MFENKSTLSKQHYELESFPGVLLRLQSSESSVTLC